MSQLPQSDSFLLCRIPRTSLLHLIISVGMVLSCHSLKSRTPNMWLTNTSVIYKSIWKSDNFSQSQGHKTSLKGCSHSWYSPQKKILMYKNVESVPLLIIEPLRFKEKKMLSWTTSFPHTSAIQGADKTCCFYYREHETLEHATEWKKMVGAFLLCTKFCIALLCPDWETDIPLPSEVDPHHLSKGHWTYLLNAAFQLLLILPWGSLLFRFFVMVWGNALTFYGVGSIWIQPSSSLQLLQVGFGFYMCCPLAIPNDDSITEVTHVITSLVLSFIVWHLYWSGYRLAALDETLHDFKSRFKNRLFPLWDIRYL